MKWESGSPRISSLLEGHKVGGCPKRGLVDLCCQVGRRQAGKRELRALLGMLLSEVGLPHNLPGLPSPAALARESRELLAIPARPDLATNTLAFKESLAVTHCLI